jgi:hypothetical protein
MRMPMEMMNCWNPDALDPDAACHYDIRFAVMALLSTLLHGRRPASTTVRLTAPAELGEDVLRVDVVLDVCQQRERLQHDA